MSNSPVTKLIEECSELIKALCKADRFGWLNWHPERPGVRNIDDVLLEIADVRDACDTLEKKLREAYGCDTLEKKLREVYGIGCSAGQGHFEKGRDDRSRNVSS